MRSSLVTQMLLFMVLIFLYGHSDAQEAATEPAEGNTAMPTEPPPDSVQAISPEQLKTSSGRVEADKSPHCADWAAKGECVKNLEYMQKHCATSCAPLSTSETTLEEAPATCSAQDMAEGRCAAPSPGPAPQPPSPAGEVPVEAGSASQNPFKLSRSASGASSEEARSPPPATAPPDLAAEQEAKRIAEAEADAQEAERKAAEEAQRKAAEEAQRRAAEEADRQVAEEEERKAAMEAERKAAEEAERKAAEEAERKAAMELERKAAEEMERKATEEAERKAAEEAERQAAIEAERKAAEEAERQAAVEAERKAAEEAERQAAVEAERKAAEEAERTAAIEAERKAAEEAERTAAMEAERKVAGEAERRAAEEAQRKTAEEAERLAAAEQAEEFKAAEEAAAQRAIAEQAALESAAQARLEREEAERAEERAQQAEVERLQRLQQQAAVDEAKQKTASQRGGEEQSDLGRPGLPSEEVTPPVPRPPVRERPRSGEATATPESVFTKPLPLPDVDWKAAVIVVYSIARTIVQWAAELGAEGGAKVVQLAFADPPINVIAIIFAMLLAVLTFFRSLPTGAGNTGTQRPQPMRAAAPSQPVVVSQSIPADAFAPLQQQFAEMQRLQERVIAELRQSVSDTAHGLAKLSAELQVFQKERCSMDEELLLSTKEILEWIGNGVASHGIPSDLDAHMAARVNNSLTREVLHSALASPVTTEGDQRQVDDSRQSSTQVPVPATSTVPEPCASEVPTSLPSSFAEQAQPPTQSPPSSLADPPVQAMPGIGAPVTADVLREPPFPSLGSHSMSGPSIPSIPQPAVAAAPPDSAPVMGAPLTSTQILPPQHSTAVPSPPSVAVSEAPPPAEPDGRGSLEPPEPSEPAVPLSSSRPADAGEAPLPPESAPAPVLDAGAWAGQGQVSAPPLSPVASALPPGANEAAPVALPPGPTVQGPKAGALAGPPLAGPPSATSLRPPQQDIKAQSNPFGRPAQQPIQAAASPFGMRPQQKDIVAKSSPFG